MVVEDLLPKLWGQVWRQYSDRTALAFREKHISYGELDTLTSKVGEYVASRFELHFSENVVLMATGSEASVVLNLSLIRAGITVVPVNPSLSLSELCHIIDTTHPKVVISFGDDYMNEMRSACIVNGNRLYETAVKDQNRCQYRPNTSNSSPFPTALIAFTSGTTAAPKGVPISNSAIVWNISTLARLWELSCEDSLYLSLPLFHIHGLVVGLYGALSVGASIFVEDRFSSEVLGELLDSRKVNVFFGVPTMYHRLFASGKAKYLANARLAVSGSAPLSRALFDSILEVSGRPVVERYGMTETLIIASNPYRGDKRPGSVGVPLPDTHVSFSRDGEIIVSSPGVFSGYLPTGQNKTVDAPSRSEFHTGDLGHMDDDYLYIDGRKKDLIITGGHNVHPLEVEEVISRMDSISEVAVVGKPSPEWGEELVAFIVANDSVDQNTIKEFARVRLSGFKVPKHVVFVESLPKNALGKLDRKALKTEYL